jgi:hypothetical protein
LFGTLLNIIGKWMVNGCLWMLWFMVHVKIIDIGPPKLITKLNWISCEQRCTSNQPLFRSVREVERLPIPWA